MVYHEGARRLETADVAIGPRVCYLGKPEHIDLVLASFPPHPPRLLAAGEAWRRFLNAYSRHLKWWREEKAKQQFTPGQGCPPDPS
jgi:hypothetical protein